MRADLKAIDPVNSIHLPGRVHRPIRLRLIVIQVHIPIHFHARCIFLHLLSPMHHILYERSNILLLAQIDRLLVLPQLPDLRTSSNVRKPVILLIDLLIDSSSDLSFQNIFAQMGLLSHWSRETAAINCLKGLDHRADCLEATSDVGLRVREISDNAVRKVEKEGFSLLAALALVQESEGLVRSAAEFNEIEFGAFEELNELLRFVLGEAALLKFDTVDLDADDEAGFWGSFARIACAVSRMILDRPFRSPP